MADKSRGHMFRILGTPLVLVVPVVLVDLRIQQGPYSLEVLTDPWVQYLQVAPEALYSPCCPFGQEVQGDHYFLGGLLSLERRLPP